MKEQSQNETALLVKETLTNLVNATKNIIEIMKEKNQQEMIEECISNLENSIKELNEIASHPEYDECAIVSTSGTMLKSFGKKEYFNFMKECYGFLAEKSEDISEKYFEMETMKFIMLELKCKLQYKLTQLKEQE